MPAGKAANGPYLERPTRVGAYPSNKLGLCDMHGNMAQWTDTVWGPSRVIRGSCWGLYSPSCRAADRTGYQPRVRLDHLGFRLARVPFR